MVADFRQPLKGRWSPCTQRLQVLRFQMGAPMVQALGKSQKGFLTQ